MSSTEQHAKSLLHSEYVGTHTGAFKRAAIETRSSLEMDTISLKTFTELPSGRVSPMKKAVSLERIEIG
jgi:hypothetical protein